MRRVDNIMRFLCLPNSERLTPLIGAVTMLFLCGTAAPLPASESPRATDFRINAAGDLPRWEQLDPYQFTMTEAEFRAALSSVYSEGEAYKTHIRIAPDHAAISRSTAHPEWPPYRLNFAASPATKRAPAGEGIAYWRPSASLPVLEDREKPLAGLHIAVDAGHLGGKWAEMEARWFQIGDHPPVTEGSMTLRVAKLLRPRLEALGAEVTLVRRELEPVTLSRPADFAAEARVQLRRNGIANPRERYDDLAAHSVRKRFTVQWQSELLFYRAREIRDRAREINEEYQPDLVLCLHFNAEAWGDPERPTLVAKNHLHVLCNGTYSAGEIGIDDIRFEMMRRVVEGIHEEEIPLCSAVAKSMAEVTGLPAYVYPGTNAKRVDDNPYLFARNLLANRTYRCPVVFLEPYVMNNQTVFDRIQGAADEKPNIFEEYADGVTRGLVEYYRAARER